MSGAILKILILIFIALLCAAVFLFSFSKQANDCKFEIGENDKLKNGGIEESLLLKNGDIGPQKPLANSPEEVKAIYLTAQSAGNPKKVDEYIGMIKKANLNAVVIDIKDYSGYVFYESGVEEVAEYKAEKIIISKINSLIKKFHNENIYVIARIVVFQDPLLAAARPDLAVKNRTSGKLWKDNMGLAWIDPSSKDGWDYIIKISRDAAERGFDEINFDYVRFPSDGYLDAMRFPFYEEKNISKEQAIRDFFSYLRFNLKDAKISADLFGLTTSAKDDLGIGQIIEHAYENFDYVSPMVYPSHYAKGFLGFEEPAKHPYEVVKYAIESAAAKFDEYNKAVKKEGAENKKISGAKIRPWIQAFNMGDVYDIAKIKTQIKASEEAGGIGWMLWNPANNYNFLNGLWL